MGKEKLKKVKSNFYGEEKFLKKKVCLSGQLAHDWHVIHRHMVEHVEQLPLCLHITHYNDFFLQL